MKTVLREVAPGYFRMVEADAPTTPLKSGKSKPCAGCSGCGGENFQPPSTPDQAEAILREHLQP